MNRKADAFEMKNYGKRSTFSSFLPGISGINGIPIWCYYVNRGQCVVCFGVEDKDHAIMEFFPAHQAYQNVKRTGFRTFIKRDGTYFEPFQEESKYHQMKIEMNGLELVERDEEHNVETKVVYYTLPGEKVGALVRMVTIQNIGETKANFEVLDGMPALIPYGVDEKSMKMMGQTIKAWMQVEEIESNIPYFKVRASTEDSASVSEIPGGNFSFACLEDGTKLEPFVDPELIFQYDTTLHKAVGFMEEGLEGLKEEKQVTQNQLPCSFYGTTKELLPGEVITMYQIIGQVANKEILKAFVSTNMDSNYFKEKKREADGIVNELCSGIKTKTASKEFDAYCEYTYLDNILRGGYPIVLGKNKIFYVYSRKHGDIERDYNFFRMLPEFFSQGNGNYRDVNQNRRCDVSFAPYVGDVNIKSFYSLIQLDGYNPLGVEKVSYTIRKDDAEYIFQFLSSDKKDLAIASVVKAFTPGEFFKLLDELELYHDNTRLDIFNQVMEVAESLVNGNFGEGYWSDHWTYNLDLIENYLDVYPEKEEDLLFAKEYSYFLSQVNINKRKKRYVITEKGIRQYHALDESSKRNTAEKLVRNQYGNGDVVYSSLLEKLILLSATKFATLDAYGMGVEMEGGKPGWYDALNGLPGIFGSSMAETYELGRNLDYTIGMLKKYTKEMELLSELAEFVEELDRSVEEEIQAIETQNEVIGFWNKINDAKEKYREKTYADISGQRKTIDGNRLIAILEKWYHVVRVGIRKACTYENGICPTYFSYEVTSYVETEEGIEPLHFEVRKVPLFLEGPVRYLKLGNSIEHKKELYHNIKESDLFDQKLSMYKVNASLKDASYELGRCKAFTPGWLENESIWLHMEYKYLLELLKSGLYEEFITDSHKALIPFLDPSVYGRSIYENSSFIASSQNPNEKYHGKGFVARLSGSTVEFIHMWKIMMFGKNPFNIKNQELTLSLQPTIPHYLIGEERKIEAAFLSNINVTYLLSNQKDYIPGQYKISSIQLQYVDGSSYVTSEQVISGQRALDIRTGKVANIVVKLT